MSARCGEPRLQNTWEKRDCVLALQAGEQNEQEGWRTLPAVKGREEEREERYRACVCVLCRWGPKIEQAPRSTIDERDLGTPALTPETLDTRIKNHLRASCERHVKILKF